MVTASGEEPQHMLPSLETIRKSHENKLFYIAHGALQNSEKIKMNNRLMKVQVR